MKYASMVFQTLVLLYLSSLLFFLLTGYAPAAPGYHPPFVIFVIDTINLFIHEAGHFFLKPLGMWIHIMGGSLFQVLVPTTLLVVTWRQNAGQIVYPGFWLGENLVNVSAYIRDAPYRQLKLIARGLIHDWNWLLSGNLEMAEQIADVAFALGLLVCAASLTSGGYWAVQKIRGIADSHGN